MRRFKGALVDMDGVLYDSMPGHTLAWKRIMDDAGIKLPREEYYLYEGMTGVATVRMLALRELGRELSDEECHRLYDIKALNFSAMGEPPLMDGTAEVLSLLGRRGVVRVLVTGSGQKSMLEKIERDYPGVFREDLRVTSHDVIHGKPDPEPYLKGASLAGLDASDCMVIENAPLGVLAGKRAGAFVCAVMTGPVPRKEFEKAGADMIFEDMHALARWIEKNVETCIG